MTQDYKVFPIKRFMLFSWDQYYPGGGFNNCDAWADNTELLKSIAGSLGPIKRDFCYILDTQTGEELDLK